MGSQDRPPRYRSFLLRFWEERGKRADNANEWRFSLEDPRTGERTGFPTLEKLFTFIREATGQGKPPDKKDIDHRP